MCITPTKNGKPNKPEEIEEAVVEEEIPTVAKKDEADEVKSDSPAVSDKSLKIENEDIVEDSDPITKQ